MDYCKDELTTGQRVGTAAFGAVISTIVGVGAIWMLLIEETFIGWIFLAHLPYAISQWVAVFRSGVRSLRGEIVVYLGTAVILLVGWHRVDDWPSTYFLAIVFVFAFAFSSYIWCIRRYYQTKD